MHRRTSFMELALLLAIGCHFSALAQIGSPSLVDIKAAAEAGDPVAQEQYAGKFFMRMDTQQAEIWYRKAAEQGYAPAQAKLGQMLLSRNRYVLNGKAAERAAAGDEAFRWLTLAATQGDKRGQADLAEIYLEGKLVKQDLIEAFKWGDLATGVSDSLIGVARIMGRSTRDAATLKMTAEQIAEAKRRVAAFVPHKPGKDELPGPAWLKQIQLTGISGPENRRLALIGGSTFAPGETGTVKAGGRSVKVRCVEIREKSVVVEIEGTDQPRELFLDSGTR